MKGVGRVGAGPSPELPDPIEGAKDSVPPPASTADVPLAVRPDPSALGSLPRTSPWLRMSSLLGMGAAPLPVSTVRAVNLARDLLPVMAELPDEALVRRVRDVGERMRASGDGSRLRAELLAGLREVSRRTIGMTPFDVQLAAATVLATGGAAEMKTGEGKTLAAALASAELAMTEGSCHVATSSPYLAERDATRLRPFFQKLGIRVAAVLPGMSRAEKREAYRADVVYGSAETFAFDWLEDQLAFEESDRVQRKLTAAIVDEADEVLIDASETPLILSGDVDRSDQSLEKRKAVERANEIVLRLDPKEHLEIRYEKERIRPVLNAAGIDFVERAVAEMFGEDPTTFNLWQPDHSLLLLSIWNAVHAHYSIRRDEHYIADQDALSLVNASTGQAQPSTRWRDGLTEAVMMKEGREIEPERRTLGQITYQNYFRMYGHLSGMSGTLRSVKSELSDVYHLELVAVPTKEPLLRIDEPDRFFPHPAVRDLAAARDLALANAKGQPVLVATSSVAQSKHVSARLENPLLLLADVAVSSAPLLRRALELVRGGEAHLDATKIDQLDDEGRHALHPRVLDLLAKDGGGAMQFASFLESRGVPAKFVFDRPEGFEHQVLNAEHHAEEAGVIARAGQRGAITVATQMAGRGADIPLGDGIDRLGGLRVIGIGHQSNVRRDDQLRGRAGRQGAPGSSVFYVSPADPLFSFLPASKLRHLAGRLASNTISDPSGTLLSEWRAAVTAAQDRAEGSGREMRRMHLMFDDVVQSMRKTVARIRADAMAAGDLVPVVKQFFWEAVERATDRYELIEPELSRSILGRLGASAPEEPITLDQLGARIDEAWDAHVQALAEAQQALGHDASDLEGFTRSLFLQLLDRTWMSYLVEIEAVRESAWMHAHAQRNPQVEFAITASQVFDESMDLFQGNVLERWLMATESVIQQAK